MEGSKGLQNKSHKSMELVSIELYVLNSKDWPQQLLCSSNQYLL